MLALWKTHALSTAERKSSAAESVREQEEERDKGMYDRICRMCQIYTKCIIIVIECWELVLSAFVILLISSFCV